MNLVDKMNTLKENYLPSNYKLNNFLALIMIFINFISLEFLFYY